LQEQEERTLYIPTWL